MWTGDDYKDSRKGDFLGFDDLKTWTGDDHKDFQKDDSSVFEERSILEVLGECSLSGRKF